MKALYCQAGDYFIKAIADDHKLSDGATMHLENGQWISANVPESFDGNLAHYKLVGVEMVLIPQAEWPEVLEEAQRLADEELELT